MLIHEVITSENVPFSYGVAGLGARFLAWLVDLAVILLVGFIGIMVANVLEIGRAGLGLAIMTLWVFGLMWGYFLMFEWLWHGQTPGKRLLGIRVIQMRGTGMSFFQAAVRNLLRAVDSLPFLYGVGFIVAACNREHLRLGDLAAGTLVVHVQLRAHPIGVIHDAVSEADQARRALLHQRLEQLDRAQKQTLLDLCLRRNQLRLRDRSQLFSAVAEYFRGRWGLHPEEYQSDEKFILAVAALLSATTTGAALDRRPSAEPLPEPGVSAPAS